MNQYIAHPPGTYSTSPWLYVDGGTVRYATSHDTAPASYVLNEEQYVFLHKSAGLGTPTRTYQRTHHPAPGIYAGIDTNGKNYNVNEWIVTGGGQGLYRQADGSLRSVQLRNGQVIFGLENPQGYSRPELRLPRTLPYTVSGEIKIHDRSADGSITILGENRTPTWQHGICFAPVFVDEDNNLMDCCKPAYTKWGSSGQIDKTYGIPFVLRYNAPIRHDDIMDGAWHGFRMEVPEVGHHLLFVDGVRMVELEEKTPPAPWWNRPLKAGLRLDFYDYSLRNLKVTS